MAQRRKAPNIPAKLHGDDREIVGFLQYLIDYKNSFVPTGCAVRNFRSDIPTGFLSCNGATFSATDYPDLYTVLGSTTLPTLAGYVLKT